MNTMKSDIFFLMIIMAINYQIMQAGEQPVKIKKFKQAIKDIKPITINKHMPVSTIEKLFLSEINQPPLLPCQAPQSVSIAPIEPIKNQPKFDAILQSQKKLEEFCNKHKPEKKEVPTVIVDLFVYAMQSSQDLRSQRIRILFPHVVLTKDSVGKLPEEYLKPGSYFAPLINSTKEEILKKRKRTDDIV